MNRLFRWLFPAKPLEPSELERAHLLREAARARYLDALGRHDSRDQHAYQAQFVKATNRVLALESGSSRDLSPRFSAHRAVGGAGR